MSKAQKAFEYIFNMEAQQWELYLMVN
jgi:hypothetical protein